MRLLYQITNGARDMSFGELESRQARGELLGKLGELVHGATSLDWQTAKDNARAQRVYERVGATRAEWVDYSLRVTQESS